MTWPISLTVMDWTSYVPAVPTPNDLYELNATVHIWSYDVFAYDRHANAIQAVPLDPHSELARVNLSLALLAFVVRDQSVPQ